MWKQSSQTVRQVWIPAPITASLQPRDESCPLINQRTRLGADPFDVILGIIGIDPADRDQTGVTLKALS
jgi:hypothetical protein